MACCLLESDLQFDESPCWPHLPSTMHRIEIQGFGTQAECQNSAAQRLSAWQSDPSFVGGTVTALHTATDCCCAVGAYAAYFTDPAVTNPNCNNFPRAERQGCNGSMLGCPPSLVSAITQAFPSGCNGDPEGFYAWIKSRFPSCNARGCCCTGGTIYCGGPACFEISDAYSCSALGPGCTARRDGGPCQGTREGVSPCVRYTNDPNCASPTRGCCFCDRCCDMDSTTCLSKGGVPLGTSTVPISCTTQAGRDACKQANIRPACRKGTWKLAQRPTAHMPAIPDTANPIVPSATYGTGFMSIASVAGQRNIDRANPNDECKIVYAGLSKSVLEPPFGAMEGSICNTYNDRCKDVSTGSRSPKVTQRMRLVGGPEIPGEATGYFQFEGSYRPPCPEQADMGCTTISGCPA